MNGEGLKVPWSGAIVSGLVLIGIGYVAGGQKAKPQPVTVTQPEVSKPSQPAATEPTDILVHVSGAVQKPGVYSFKPGQRVQDAIEAAGGGLKGARINDINLAMKLQDEQAIFVPAADAPAAMTKTPPTGKTSATGSPKPPATRISLMTATAQELETLPGIGPAIAERIIEFREKYGFRDTAELDLVSGISTPLCQKLMPLVRL